MNSTDTATAAATRLLARAAEQADAASWLDMFAAAPTHVATGLALATRQAGDLVMVRSAIPFSHFNMVLTLGCPAAADERAWDEIERYYAGEGHWVVINDQSQPAGLPTQLADRGYRRVDAWDRVIAERPRPDLWDLPVPGAELVTAATVDEWAAFVCATYGMPPAIGEWLRALAGAPGWIHAIRRDVEHADRPVIMARSAYVAGGWAWLGVDAPVPGVMSACFDDDHAVSATLLREATERGAARFVTDIEAPSPERHGPGYDCWRRLGFEPRYLRTVFHRESVRP